MEPVWTEKYRPKSFDSIIGQPQAVSRLSSLVSCKNLPHLLLSGPSGSGKTSCALISADIALSGNVTGNFLEMEASDLTKKRDVEKTVVDDDGNVTTRKATKTESSPLWRIKEFASTGSIDGIGFRVIYIDGVDRLSKEIQEALRRTIEVHSSNCAFILSCNQPSRIIDPIKSRCVTVNFVPISKDVLSDRLGTISREEGFDVGKDTCDLITDSTDGNIRKAIWILQTACISGKKIDAALIDKLTETPIDSMTKEMITIARTGDLMKARDVLDRMMIENGMSGREVVSRVADAARAIGMGDQELVRLMDKIGETDLRVTQCGGGQNILLERIQIENLLAYLAMTGGTRR